MKGKRIVLGKKIEKGDYDIIIVMHSYHYRSSKYVLCDVNIWEIFFLHCCLKEATITHELHNINIFIGWKTKQMHFFQHEMNK